MKRLAYVLFMAGLFVLLAAPAALAQSSLEEAQGSCPEGQIEQTFVGDETETRCVSAAFFCEGLLPEDLAASPECIEILGLEAPAPAEPEQPAVDVSNIDQSGITPEYAAFLAGTPCGQFPSQAAAQAALRADPSDPNGLDPATSDNRNGVACEIFPYADPTRDETPVVFEEEPVAEEPVVEEPVVEEPVVEEPVAEEPAEAAAAHTLPDTGGASLLLPVAVLLLATGLIGLRVIRRRS